MQWSVMSAYTPLSLKFSLLEDCELTGDEESDLRPFCASLMLCSAFWMCLLNCAWFWRRMEYGLATRLARLFLATASQPAVNHTRPRLNLNQPQIVSAARTSDGSPVTTLYDAAEQTDWTRLRSNMFQMQHKCLFVRGFKLWRLKTCVIRSQIKVWQQVEQQRRVFSAPIGSFCDITHLWFLFCWAPGLQINISSWKDMCQFACPANRRPKNTIKKKNSQTFAHDVNFSKNKIKRVCHVW